MHSAIGNILLNFTDSIDSYMNAFRGLYVVPTLHVYESKMIVSYNSRKALGAGRGLQVC